MKFFDDYPSGGCAESCVIDDPADLAFFDSIFQQFKQP